MDILTEVKKYEQVCSELYKAVEMLKKQGGNNEHLLSHIRLYEAAIGDLEEKLVNPNHSLGEGTNKIRQRYADKGVAEKSVTDVRKLNQKFDKLFAALDEAKVNGF